MKILKFTILLLICIMMAAFAAHNSNYVPLNFYPFGTQISIAAFFLIFICLTAGALLSAAISAIKFIHYRRVIRNKDKEIRKLETELSSLRAAGAAIPGGGYHPEIAASLRSSQ